MWSFGGRMMALERDGPWGHDPKITVFVITIVVTITANIKKHFLEPSFQTLKAMTLLIAVNQGL